ATCGAALQAAITDGGTHFVCAGTYQGNFNATTAVTLIGAGQGAAPASNTILTQNEAVGIVLPIDTGVGPVVLQRLRVTGGKTDVNPPFGAGISHEGDLLQMQECTVANNTAANIAGGIYVQGGSTLEMTNCTVQNNQTAVDGLGGGIASAGAMRL